CVVGPGAAHRAEHVAPEDPGADVLEAAAREAVVHARVALGRVAEHGLEGACRKGPFVQREAAEAEGVLQALLHAGAEAVERHAEALDPQAAHGAACAGGVSLVSSSASHSAGSTGRTS